jgi:hypothetical protein
MLRVDGSAALAKADLLRTAWEHLKAIDERLLGLAVANTNLKAMRLSVGDAASALDRFIAVLEEMITASSDPARIRELSIASIAAMRIQTLHGPHIVSTDDQEMDRLEGKMGTSRRALESVLSKLRLDPESAGSSPLREATTAWADYERATSEVIRLSRENTNLRSFDLSIHEKRRATEAFRNALADLAREIQSSVSHATR